MVLVALSPPALSRNLIRVVGVAVTAHFERNSVIIECGTFHPLPLKIYLCRGQIAFLRRQSTVRRRSAIECGVCPKYAYLLDFMTSL